MEAPKPSSPRSKTLSERVVLPAPVFHFSSNDRKTPMTFHLCPSKIQLIANEVLCREIALSELEAITLSESSSEFVLHVIDDEDERLSCPSMRREIIETILRLITLKRSKDEEVISPLFPLYFVKDVNLFLFVTTSEDLEEGRLIRPADECKLEMNYKTYVDREQKQDEMRKKKKESTRMIFTSTKKHVSAEDFELLKVLGKGAHGKVLLCEKKQEKGKLYAMKILKKQHIIEAKQLEHTKAENLILSSETHPFLVSLKYAFQTDEKIYFIMEFMKGGELFQHLKRVFKFSEEQTKFIAACLILAIGHLHNNDYIYRDLKPENVLLDERGYAKLTDFGLAKSLKLQELAKTFCGTPEYLSPEVILDKGCNRPADWWSLGILIYEMIFGIPPFYSKNVQKMYKNTVINPLKFKSDTHCSDAAKDFIFGLLTKDPEKRLGSLAGSLELMHHPWFQDFDWVKLINQQLIPPYNPSSGDRDWVANFDPDFTKEKPSDSICYLDPKLLEDFRKDFADFGYFSAEIVQKSEEEQITSSEGENKMETESPEKEQRAEGAEKLNKLAKEGGLLEGGFLVEKQERGFSEHLLTELK